MKVRLAAPLRACAATLLRWAVRAPGTTPAAARAMAFLDVSVFDGKSGRRSRPTEVLARDRRVFAVADVCAALVIGAVLLPSAATAQDEGGLYIAGDGFTFQQAAERGMAQNPGGRRFFVLALPPQTDALTTAALPQLARVRDRVLAANGVLLVCQRDVDSRRIDANRLVPGVVAVRGWPPASAGATTQRYFPGEDPSNLPTSDEALRRLRATCTP